MIYWIKNGELTQKPKASDGKDIPEKQLFTQWGAVKVDSLPSGTQIQWCMGAPNWSSLMFAAVLLQACTGPFQLKYFNKGWFEETVPDRFQAAVRLEELLLKSDVHLIDRTYNVQCEPDSTFLTAKLRRVLEAGSVDEQEAVICRVDQVREMSGVEAVGSKTDLNRIWGLSPVSFPCLSGNSYDRTVSKSYFDAVRNGRPVYDHVLAAMVTPKGEHRWIGYQRVILPEKQSRGNWHHVHVVTDLAPVSIKLV